MVLISINKVVFELNYVSSCIMEISTSPYPTDTLKEVEAHGLPPLHPFLCVSFNCELGKYVTLNSARRARPCVRHGANQINRYYRFSL